MLKKIIIGICLLIVCSLGLATYTFLNPKPADEHIVLDFIKENPDRSAIKLVRNDSILAEVNPDKVMSLASTRKIIIAIEYAVQAANKSINPDELVSFDELNKFHVPRTDGGAHPKWLKSMKRKSVNDSTSIRSIAQGMITYSSNANTEWLSAKLGLDNINNRIDSLGIKKHSDIYYVVSSLFVGKEAFPGANNKELKEKLEAMKIEAYIGFTNQIHDKILADTNYIKTKGDRSRNIQKIWSNNLPNSTVNEYASLMKKINSKTYFNNVEQTYLDELMEGLMKNPANQAWLAHAGRKGGSTGFVLTKAMYATDKKGNKTELAYFFENLESTEKRRLGKNMNQFELKVLNDAEFRDEIINLLR